MPSLSLWKLSSGENVLQQSFSSSILFVSLVTRDCFSLKEMNYRAFERQYGNSSLRCLSYTRTSSRCCNRVPSDSVDNGCLLRGLYTSISVLTSYEACWITRTAKWLIVYFVSKKASSLISITLLRFPIDPLNLVFVSCPTFFMGSGILSYFPLSLHFIIVNTGCPYLSKKMLSSNPPPCSYPGISMVILCVVWDSTWTGISQMP